jgi:predicted permease
MNGFIQDARFAVRHLRKSPGFVAVALLTLALGIGANTALFSIVNGVLLNPLPFPQADQLIALGENKPNFENGSISYPNFHDWKKDNRTFSSMAVARPYSFNLLGSGEAEQVSGEFVSSDFFSLLGVQPIAGRAFMAGEDEIGAAPVALISEGLWRRKFSAAPDVVGRNIVLGAKSFTVVGIVPASFHLNIPSFREVDIYAPAGQWSNPLLSNRGAGLGFHGIGRLKPRVTLEQARADMDHVTRNLAVAYPDADQGISANLLPLKQRMLGDVKPLLLVLLGAVGFVLLIACVNVANLVLARSSGRSREFAIRAALGAGQSRMMRQLLTESVLLSLTGGLIGVLIAAWGTRATVGILPSALPRVEEINLDLRVLAFSGLISLLAGILFGLVPALKMSKADVNESLKEGGRSGSVRHRAQSVFVVSEMAMAVVLLAGAGLMIRSLMQLWHVDPGFDPHHVADFGVSFPPSMVNAGPDAIRNYMRELDRKFTAIPGVMAVAQTSGAMPLQYEDDQLFWLDGQPKPANDKDMNWAIDYIVGPDYLKVMEIPLQKGRFFTVQDDEHSPLRIVVDDVFARKYFPGQEAIGKRLHLKWSNQLAEVVGVVGHVKQWGLDIDDTQALRAQLYIPSMQMPDDYIRTTSGAGILFKTQGEPSSAFAAIRKASQEMSSEQVIYGEETQDEVIVRSLGSQRFLMVLLGIFAALALLLACVGIYGVISYVVGQRTHEIGVRMALGAQRGDVLRLILGQGTRLVVVGIAIGIGGAVGLTRLMASQLFMVSATDPLTFAGVSLTLVLVALGACYIPARRAAKVDPIVALRYE